MINTNIFVLILISCFSLSAISQELDIGRLSPFRADKNLICKERAKKWKKKILRDLGEIKCKMDYKDIKESFYQACEKEINQTCSAESVKQSEHPKKIAKKCKSTSWLEERLKKDIHQNHANTYADIWSKCGGGAQGLAEYKEKIEAAKNKQENKKRQSEKSSKSDHSVNTIKTNQKQIDGAVK